LIGQYGGKTSTGHQIQYLIGALQKYDVQGDYLFKKGKNGIVSRPFYVSGVGYPQSKHVVGNFTHSCVNKS